MKRGISTEGAIITVVIFGIILIIFIILYKMLYSIGNEQFTDKECQASLLLTSATDLPKLCELAPQSPIPIHCNRKFLKVDDKVLDENNDHADLTQIYSSQCPAGVSQSSCLGENVVAKEMASCWKLFFEGQRAVFQQVAIREYGFEPNDDKTACFICSEIVLNNGAKNLGNYLQEASMDGKTTYYQYLTKKALCGSDVGTPCFDMLPKYLDEHSKYANFKDIDRNSLTSGTYAVIFIRRGLGSCQDSKVKDGSDAAISNAVEVIPADKIASVCNAVIV